MDITSRKHSKIITLNEYTSTTVRNIATPVGVGESREFQEHFKILDHHLQKEKEYVAANRKLLQELRKF